MKSSPFAYLRVQSLDEALEALAADPGASKVIAGGQSLVPMMNLRLARPGRLVDINSLTELTRTTVTDNEIIVGALVRHRDLETAVGVPGPIGGLLRSAARQIGHLPIRTRGTFGGSLAHSDPASEWCLLAQLLDATVVVHSVRGTREIPARDLFLGMFTTTLAPDELIVEVRLPRLGEHHRTGIEEYARRAGDFAIVAALTDAALDPDGVVTAARICLGGVGEVAWRSEAAESVLQGRRLDADSAASAAEAAAEEATPPSDGVADADFRRDLVRALVSQALMGQGDG